MTTEELLNDLDERLARGVEYMAEMVEKYPYSADRLVGKQEGLKLVRDWLRSYR